MFIRGLKRNVHDKLKCHQLCGICFVAHNEKDLKSNHTQSTWIYRTTTIHYFCVCEPATPFLHFCPFQTFCHIFTAVSFILERQISVQRHVLTKKKILNIIVLVLTQTKMKFNLHTLTFCDNMPHSVTLFDDFHEEKNLFYPHRKQHLCYCIILESD